MTNALCLAKVQFSIQDIEQINRRVLNIVSIGENIRVLARVISTAIKERDSEVIQNLAKAQAEAGADYIDLNVGPMRKNPEKNIQWLVSTVQEVIDLPLSIDTMNPVAMEAGIKPCQKRPLLNSASGKTDSKEQILPLARKYNCDVVISVMTDKGMPPGVDSKIESIMDTVTYANELGISNEDIWVDPIILPVSTAGEGQRFAVACLEFVKILEDILPKFKSAVGLSNISNGVPSELRPLFNRVQWELSLEMK